MGRRLEAMEADHRAKLKAAEARFEVSSSGSTAVQTRRYGLMLLLHVVHD